MSGLQGTVYGVPEYVTLSEEDRWAIEEKKSEEFRKVIAPYRAVGSLIICRPRPDLDPSSRTIPTSNVKYTVGEKEKKLGIMEVMKVGPGRVRLGYREPVDVQEGDLVMISLMTAAHWLVFGGLTYYCFTNEAACAKMHRTDKSLTPPPPGPERDLWNEQDFWKIETLQDFVLLAEDNEAFKQMYFKYGGASKLILDDTSFADGYESDSKGLRKFPIAYRRILQTGPGKYLKAIDYGIDLAMMEVQKCDAPIGASAVMTTATQVMQFKFQGRELSFIRSAQMLCWKDPIESVYQNLPESVN